MRQFVVSRRVKVRNRKVEIDGKVMRAIIYDGFGLNTIIIKIDRYCSMTDVIKFDILLF